MLYKYIGNHDNEVTIRCLKYFLEDGTIRASNPSSFNDPSELKIDLDVNTTRSIAKKRHRKEGHNKSNFDQWFDGLNKAKQASVEATRRQLMSRHGVICLTRNPDNYLMWSHYSASHTGFCIGFDDDFVGTIDNVALAMSVEYSEKVPVYNYFTDPDIELSKKIFFTKHKCWSYENEYRVIVDSQGIKKFNKSHIKEVVLGTHAPRELELYARTFLDTGIKIYKMKSPYNTYSLVKTEITS
ncbi:MULTISPECIES: DUF2971 domain-containing protein [Klebsiella pneumoniae complex]|uniref:DUF2971 domain-containing protein n=1 Tax=Klebsiella pneumoniae complex TaxID=3390273 RepID=UPI002B062506|nr:DUF2971 domain-containing protein [Klebsiella quasipneumoniae]